MTDEFWKQLGTLAAIGVAITAGKELDNVKNVKKEWAHLLSKVILGAFLAMSAASLLLFFPEAPFIAIAGAAAAIMILGEKIVMRWIEKKWFKDNG